MVVWQRGTISKGCSSRWKVLMMVHYQMRQTPCSSKMALLCSIIWQVFQTYSKWFPIGYLTTCPRESTYPLVLIAIKRGPSLIWKGNDIVPVGNWSLVVTWLWSGRLEELPHERSEQISDSGRDEWSLMLKCLFAKACK